MTDQATRVVPAGWYQDPASSEHVRWWNGLTWTEHVEDKPTRPASSETKLAEARQLEREVGISTAENAIMTQQAAWQPSTSAADASLATASTGAPARAITASATGSSRTTTGGAVLLSLVPLFAGGFLAVGFAIYLYISPTPLVALILLVLMLLTFLWAVSDHRALDARGIVGPKPAVAFALPIIGAIAYLALRARKVPGKIFLIISIVLAVLAIGAPIVAVATGNAEPALTAVRVQQAVRDDLVASGSVTSVTCPLLINDSSVGTVLTCDAVLPDGSARQVYVSFDNTAGDFSWALATR